MGEAAGEATSGSAAGAEAESVPGTAAWVGAAFLTGAVFPAGVGEVGADLFGVEIGAGTLFSSAGEDNAFSSGTEGVPVRRGATTAPRFRASRSR